MGGVGNIPVRIVRKRSWLAASGRGWRDMKRFSTGASSVMKDVYANNLSNLTDPRTICRTRLSAASQTARKLSQLLAGPRLGIAGLLPPLYHHRHGVGPVDLGAAIPLPVLPHQRQLSAGVCATLSAGQYADDRRRLQGRGGPARGSALERTNQSLLAPF